MTLFKKYLKLRHIVSESLVDWVNHTQDSDHEFTKITDKLLHTKSVTQEDDESELSDEHINKLTHKDRNAVDAYVNGGHHNDQHSDEEETSGSHDVNKHLIDSHNKGVAPQKNFHFKRDSIGIPDKHLHIDHLDDALAKNKLKAPLSTYSGVSFDPSKMIDKQNTLHMPAYTSSSTNRAVAVKYAVKTPTGRHILHIEHPKGSTGLYIGDDDTFGGFGDKEHISPRNMQLHINPIPEIHTHGTHTIHVWHAKRVAH